MSIDVSNRIWSEKDKQEWEKLIDRMESERNNLLPCPFCGRHPYIDDDQEQTGNIGGIPCVCNYFVISCCGIEFRDSHTDDGLTRLIRRWNTRMSPETARQISDMRKTIEQLKKEKTNAEQK